MIRLKKIYILLLILIFSTLICGDKCNASRNINIFNELLKNTNSKIVEIGLRVEYKTNNNGELECRNLLNNLDLNLNSKILVNNDQNFYEEFTRDEISGYVESIVSENENMIVIDIKKKVDKNDLNDIEKNVRLVVKSENTNLKIFKYVKAKLGEHNLTNLNKKLLNKIKAEGAYNIDSLKISNGYSTVANTNNFNPEISCGKLIDLNYILCNYSSGDYMIIGTPEIITSY